MFTNIIKRLSYNLSVVSTAEAIVQDIIDTATCTATSGLMRCDYDPPLQINHSQAFAYTDLSVSNVLIPVLKPTAEHKGFGVGIFGVFSAGDSGNDMTLSLIVEAVTYEDIRQFEYMKWIIREGKCEYGYYPFAELPSDVKIFVNGGLERVVETCMVSPEDYTPEAIEILENNEDYKLSGGIRVCDEGEIPVRQMRDPEHQTMFVIKLDVDGVRMYEHANYNDKYYKRLWSTDEPDYDDESMKVFIECFTEKIKKKIGENVFSVH